MSGRGTDHLIVGRDHELAVFQRADHQSPFRLTELAPGVIKEEVREKTTARYAD